MCGIERKARWLPAEANKVIGYTRIRAAHWLPYRRGARPGTCWNRTVVMVDYALTRCA